MRILEVYANLKNMSSDRIFHITLIISFLIHTAALVVNTGIFLLPSNARIVPVEIAYVKNIPKPSAPYKEITGAFKENILKINSRISSRGIPPPYINKEDLLRNNTSSMLRKSDFLKPLVPKSDLNALKKKISLPPVDLNKIDNPSYLSYYQIVREKIRRAAYQGYTKTETGEVYLTFLVSKNGTLIDERLIPDKSSSSPYLKDVASRSIRSAQPFPQFPKELDYPQLSFNVIISFEIE